MFHELRHATSGTAAIEFALVSPVLILLLVGLVEVGSRVHEGMQVQNAAEAGAIYVAKNGWSSAGITEAVTNSTGFKGITASPAPTQFCGCPTSAGITTISCTSTCSGGMAVSQYVQIDTVLTHKTVLSSFGFKLPATITGRAIIRTK